MGKSPGKWIKTLLFGKKSSRSSSTLKSRDTLKGVREKVTWTTGKEAPAELAVGTPFISEPIPASTDRNGVNELETGVASSVPGGGVVLPVDPNTANQGTARSYAQGDAEKLREEQAATKAQAAFRGYLARRAFRALRGIIRLQALIRGHLVRRQAVATLRSFQGIIKFQALVRGRVVRHSDLGLKVYKRCIQEMTQDGNPLGPSREFVSARMEKLLVNAYVLKLLAPSPKGMPLLIQYGKGETNSAWNWVERWTFTYSRQPVSLPKKVTDSKSQIKQGKVHGVESESGRSKRSVRRNPAANIDSGSTHSTSEFEKPKRNLRKVSTNPVESVQEHPQNELEKVKRSLRKISNSTAEASDWQEVELEKPKRSIKKVPSTPTDVTDQVIRESVEKVKTDTNVASVDSPDLETVLKPVAVEEPADVLHHDHLTAELHPLETSVKDENICERNGELNSKEDQNCQEHQKTSKRRASLPAKPEYSENSMPKIPTLPSYMAATESAKAKLRAQGSPRFGSDAAEKNGFTRRHSLPSSTNGKVTSTKARAQRLASGKTDKSDRSLLTSRDGNEKVTQAEWRR